MTKALPPRPDLGWLKKTAKQHLAQLRRRESSARLHQAQRDIAKEYGFKSWRALKAHVDGLSLDGQIIVSTIEGNASELARLLAAHPAKIAIAGHAWRRPLLHLAAERGHLACVDLLLRLGCDVNRRDQLDRASALHWAAQEGHLDVVERLVAAGADIEGEGDAHEMGVIGWATCFRQVRHDVAAFLIDRGAEPTIFAAVALDRPDLVRRLVEADPRLLFHQMSRFENHATALHFAVLKNRAEMVGLLLKLGADPSAKDSRGYTPLHCASSKTDKTIADQLIAAGADPMEQSPNRFESAVPILNVKDVPASIAYYVEKLGFRKEWEWGTPANYACVQRDGVRIFLCQDGQGAPGMWISVFIHDVDALFEDYSEKGAIIRQPPTSFPWGIREMNVEDLDGHRLRIGSEAGGPSDDVPLNEDP
ncbi:glyoxalase superfamily protein [Pelagibius sp.]|uniref:glyoxalase superfamily protein n=1 Tax=Pelagibius sp. TaxID=1931238 RepID=UPI00261CA265|nr:glyoxalase superfamily protein [Pelagibius sp.]